MFVSLWIWIPCIQICGAFLVYPPIDPSRRWIVVRRINNDNSRHCSQSISAYPRTAISLYTAKRNDDGDDQVENDADVENWESLSAELLLEDEDDGFNDGEWLTDKEKARLKMERQREQQQNLMNEIGSRPSNSGIESESGDPTIDSSSTIATATAEATANMPKHRPSPYTEEEEEIITAMGGKSKQRRREPGFLGDSTLMEICTDYSVPISYLADVLCMWDVPVPINVNDRLGDLVTGEQAFAIVEAVNTLDVSALHDRYSNTNIQQLCYEWDIDIQQAFEMAMKEGWILPFGVQTCLRVEQERELLRVLGSQAGLVDLSNDDDYDDGYY
jgi:hypothetical protein